MVLAGSRLAGLAQSRQVRDPLSVNNVGDNLRKDTRANLQLPHGHADTCCLPPSSVLNLATPMLGAGGFSALGYPVHSRALCVTCSVPLSYQSISMVMFPEAAKGLGGQRGQGDQP